MPKRRNFLGALLATSAGAAATVMAQPAYPAAGANPPTIIVKEKFVWPDDMPTMVARPDIPESEQIRLVKMLLDAERELITIPESYQYVAWNGFSFHLPHGPSIVPSQIAYSYRLAEQDKADNHTALFGKLKKKYSHTYGGEV